MAINPISTWYRQITIVSAVGLPIALIIISVAYYRERETSRDWKNKYDQASAMLSVSRSNERNLEESVVNLDKKARDLEGAYNAKSDEALRSDYCYAIVINNTNFDVNFTYRGSLDDYDMQYSDLRPGFQVTIIGIGDYILLTRNNVSYTLICATSVHKPSSVQQEYSPRYSFIMDNDDYDSIRMVRNSPQ